ncbi:MAG: hypothetical protein K5785_00870 [Nitrosarchaeum sp.]|nr:hypothetical protein [Nitrosarchaeum sp.]
MSQQEQTQQTNCCTIEEKSLILTTHKLWKESPASISDEARKKLQELKEKLYQFRQDKSLPVEKRQDSFDLQQMIHEILGINKMDEKYRPKDFKGTGKSGGWIATKEQRSKNVDECLEKIGKTRLDAMSPYEQGMIIATVWGTLKQ